MEPQTASQPTIIPGTAASIAAEERVMICSAASVPRTVAQHSINPGSAVALSAEEWVMICAVDGVRGISDIAETSGMPLPQAQEIAARLFKRGLLQIDPEDNHD